MSTVLYIEDDFHHSLIMDRILTSWGFTVETARDGVLGVEKARKLQPDLILLDLYLPGMSGFNVIKCLKEDPLTRSIPIIVISALPTRRNRQLTLNAGARGFIGKPFLLEELLDLIQATWSPSVQT